MRLRSVLITLLTIGLLAWFLKNANLFEVWMQLRSARVDLLAVSLVFVLATYYVAQVLFVHNARRAPAPSAPAAEAQPGNSSPALLGGTTPRWR